MATSKKEQTSKWEVFWVTFLPTALVFTCVGAWLKGQTMEYTHVNREYQRLMCEFVDANFDEESVSRKFEHVFTETCGFIYIEDKVE